MIRRLPEQIIDLNNKSSMKIFLKQGEDNGSTIPFRIIQDGAAFDITGYAINFVAKKPDNTLIVNKCNIKDAAKGKFEYLVSKQTVTAAGWMKAEIQLIKDQSMGYSFDLTIGIEENALSPIVSENELNVFTEILGKIDQASQDATHAEECMRQSCTCASQAKASKNAADVFASSALSSKNAAAGSATAAKNSENAVATSKNAAATSAAAAKTSETNAKSSETAAANSAAEASQSKVAAKASADNAKTNADNAANSATTAGAQATTATNKAAEAAASATAAKGSQDAAVLSAQAADAKATAAIGSANTAERASNSAGVAATAAFNNANEAKASADKAKASETNAASSASTAQTIADNLQGTVTAAENATTRANTAAERAEHASQTVQPDATKTRKGIVQIGDGINVNGGVISVPTPENDYTSAEKNKLAGIEEGANKYTLPTASAQTLGGIKVGDGINVSADGEISVQEADGANPGLSLNNYTAEDKDKLARIEEGANKFNLKPASTQALGGIKVGTNLSIAEDGTLNATDTTYNPATTTTPGLMSAADKVAVDGIGSATEAPSVTDKSSVWAAINEAASKGGDSALMNLLKTDLERLRNDLEGVYGAAGSWALGPDAETRDAIISEYLARLTVLTNGTAQAMQAIKGALLQRGINPGNYKIEEYANLINAALFLDLASLGRVSPGPKELKAGDLSCGYFGKVESSEFGAISGTNTAADGKIISASNLATAVGITGGTAVNETVPWHKFIFKGEIIYIAEKGIRKNISFESIASMGVVYGSKIITMNDKKFRVTLLKGIDADIYNSKKGAPFRNTASEWDILLRGLSQNPETINWGTNLSEIDLGIKSSDNKDCCTYVKEPTANYIYESGSLSGSYDYYGAITIKSPVSSYNNNNTGYTKSTKAVSSAYYWRPALRFTL